jgi:hypothetical protein
MTIRVTGTDGQGFQFPDGTPEEEIRSALDAHYTAQESPAADVAKAVGGGFERGAVGTLGIPGTIEQSVGAVGNMLADKAGIPSVNPVQPLRNAADYLARQTAGRVFNRFAPGGTGDWSADTRTDVPNAGQAAPSLPTSADVIQSYEQARGPTYRSQTTAGQVAGTVGEFLGGNAMVPGAVAPRVLGAVAGALGSEAAGRAVEGTTLEPYKPLAQVAGALVAPVAAGRLAVPFRTDPARAEAVARLEAQGITPTAGQRTGSTALRTAESALGEVPMGVDPAAGQREQLTRAMARRMGTDETALTPDVMQATADRLGGTIADINSRNVFQTDPQFGKDLQDVLRNQFSKVTVAQRQDFLNTANSLAQDIAQAGGKLSGDAYQSARTFLGTRANELRNSDAAAASAYKGLQKALDGAFTRSVASGPNPNDIAALEQARRQYAAMKANETAVTSVPQGTPEGMVTPNSIAAAAAQRSSVAQRARGQDEVAQLARDARSVLTTPPNSGTAGRLNALHLAGGVGGGALGLLAGSPMAGVGGAMAGIAGPAILSNLVNRRLGQAYLGGTLPGQCLLNGGVLSGAQALINAQAAAGLLTGREGGILGNPKRPAGILGQQR